MKTVFLTSGPRGAGKSSYCKQVAERHPCVEIISRDEILTSLFGSTELNPYEGGHEYARKIFLEKVQTRLSSQKDSLILLDYWNGFPEVRKEIIKQLRKYGAERIIAWYFVTPLGICERWYMQKDERRNEGWIKDMRLHNYRKDFHLYHKLAANITDDGFDAVVEINPCQLIFPGFTFV
jgi:predicted kinase